MAADDSMNSGSDDADAKTPSTKKIVEWTIGEWKNSKHPAKRLIYYLAAWIFSAILLCYGIGFALSFIDGTLNLIKTFRQYTFLILIVPLILLFLLNNLLPIFLRPASNAETSHKPESLTDDETD